MKCVSTKIIFHEIILQKIQKKHDEDKASKPLLLNIFVGLIVRQGILDISED